jgi:DNA processing protein
MTLAGAVGESVVSLKNELVDPAVAVQAVEGWGPRTIERLAVRFDDAASILAAGDSEIAEVLGCTESSVLRARRRIPWPALRREARWLRRRGASVISRFDGGMPTGWMGMADPPVAVRLRGSPEVLRGRPGVAIVGSRRCSPIGADLAARFAVAFVEAGWTVVSGGARGIDAAAHRAALRVGGSTVAILGSGLACPYPPEHDTLYDAIAESGAVVSEFQSEVEPRPSNFPVRNRLVAGFGPGTVVIEAGLRSGALITARLAAEDYGREVVAVPGRADLDTHAGCHRAIREGWATLVDDPGQAVELLSTQWGLLMADQRPEGESRSGFD